MIRKTATEVALAVEGKIFRLEGTIARQEAELKELRGFHYPRDGGGGFQIFVNTRRWWVFWYRPGFKCWRIHPMLDENAKLNKMRRVIFDFGRLRVSFMIDKHRFWEHRNFSWWGQEDY